MTVPFEYPTVPHKRRHGPRGYADHESFRPWLRDEFAFRCVYCLAREAWELPKGIYALDHFQPVASRPDLALEYDNLLYGCASCNLSKGCKSTPDPLAVLLAPLVEVAEDGSLNATTPDSQKLIELLGLDRPQMREFRAMWIRIIRLAIRFDPPLSSQLLSLPNDLPDLEVLRPPSGNTRPEGVGQSYHARRKRGELSETD